MTDAELQKLAEECGAYLDRWHSSGLVPVVFAPHQLQTFALRIEAQASPKKTVQDIPRKGAVKPQDFGIPDEWATNAQYFADYLLSANIMNQSGNYTLRFADGKLVGLAWD